MHFINGSALGIVERTMIGLSRCMLIKIMFYRSLSVAWNTTVDLLQQSFRNAKTTYHQILTLQFSYEIKTNATI